MYHEVSDQVIANDARSRAHSEREGIRCAIEQDARVSEQKLYAQATQRLEHLEEAS